MIRFRITFFGLKFSFNLEKIKAVKKIYYVPGLISVLIIPVLFWYYGSQKIEHLNISVIDIGLPAKLAKDKSNLMWTFEPLRNWNYKQIEIKPGKAKENSSLYVSEIKTLQKKNEKNTGIEFILNKNNTYGDFASLLNDMAIAKHDTYAIDLEKTGHLFAPVNYTDPNLKEMKYECLLCYDVITKNDIYRVNHCEKFTSQITQLPKQSYYVIFGFLLFLNISMFSIKERFQL